MKHEIVERAPVKIEVKPRSLEGLFWVMALGIVALAFVSLIWMAEVESIRKMGQCGTPIRAEKCQ